MGSAILKFFIIFGVFSGLFVVGIPMFFDVEMNVMLALVFVFIAMLMGGVAVLHHRKIVNGRHIPFLLGILIVFASSSLLYGSLSLPTKPEQYWSLSNQMITYIVIIDIVGFLLTILGIRRIVKK